MYTCVPAWYEMENYKSTTTHIEFHCFENNHSSTECLMSHLKISSSA